MLKSFEGTITNEWYTATKKLEVKNYNNIPNMQESLYYNKHNWMQRDQTTCDGLPKDFIHTTFYKESFSKSVRLT